MLGGLLMLAAAAPAQAADLRVDFAELARLVQAIAGSAKIRLNNAPAPGLMELFNPGSSVSLGSTTLPIPLDANPVPIPGASVVYYVNDINSTGVTVSARPGAVRISVTFESEGPELIGDCVSGFCNDAIMPNVEWIAPVLHVDLVPAAANGSIALAVRNVEIGGQLQATCPASSGPLARSICRTILGAANRAIARIKGEIPGRLRDQMNAPELQQKLAQGLKPYLTLGPAGEVRIANVAVDAKGIVVSFRF